MFAAARVKLERPRGRFVTQLDITLVTESPRRWRLDSALIYETSVLPPLTGARAGFKRLQNIVVPPFFVCDLASVPRVPLAFLLTGDTALAPAALHDWLYSFQPCTREQADAVLDEAMRAVKLPAWRRWLIMRAVRAFGGAAWARNVKAGRRAQAVRLICAWCEREGG